MSGQVHGHRHYVVGRGRLGETLHRSLMAAGWTAASIDDADVIWICVPDDRVEQVARETIGAAGEHVWLLHTSGHLVSDCLRLREGLHCGSLHPAYPFSSPEACMPGEILWTFEGDDELVDMVVTLVAYWHGSLVRITREQKVAYHTACVFLANLAAVPGLIARDLAAELDLPWPLMVDGLLTPLVERLRSDELPAGLTGPAVRGDRKTIQEQLEWLGHRHPADRQVYETLTDWILDHCSK